MQRGVIGAQVNELDILRKEEFLNVQKRYCEVGFIQHVPISSLFVKAFASTLFYLALPSAF